MKLFQYEMKKLLFNKNRLILLSVMFVVYALLGFTSIVGESELSNTDQTKNGRSEYMRLVSENTGKLNPEQLAESKAIFQAALTEHGRGEAIQLELSRNPALKFHREYAAFGQRVDQYWNGPDEQDQESIKGVYPIQDKLKELESTNQTDTYEHRYYTKRLETELSLGEPVFENIVFWNYYFTTFDGMEVVFLLLMVLTFFISPLFTQEVRTEMDSIVLSSAKGRREIVTAKLLCAGATSAIVTAVFLVGPFIGTCIGYGDLSGFDAPARGLEALQSTMLDMTIGGAAALGAAWLVLTAVVFGLALGFISSKTKSQSAAFGLGIVILLAGSMSKNLGRDIQKLIWPLADFNFGTLSSFGEIFGGVKAYSVFGLPVSYGTVAFAVCIALGALAALLTYFAQKKRSVV